MKLTVQDYSLTDYLVGFKKRRASNTLLPRECEVIERLTDNEIMVTDIRSVMWCVWLQHSKTPVVDIPEGWWSAVVSGARIGE